MFLSTMKNFLIIFVAICALSCYGQKDSIRNIKIIGLPILFFQPETSLGFGAAGFISFKSNKTLPNQRLSQINIGGAYTLEKQLLTYASFDLWFKENEYSTKGELGYYRYFYNYYGVGNGPKFEETYSVNFPRLRFEGTKQVLDDLYVGLKYTFDDFYIVQRDPTGELFKDVIPGSDGGRISGVGGIIKYDTRDDAVYPRSGWNNSFSSENFNNFIGSEFNYQLTTLDLIKYFTVRKKDVFATNVYGRFINRNGITPFFHLSDIGGTKRMRGYYQGYYKDKQMIGWQAEYRLPLFWRIGVVGFAGNAIVSNQIAYFKMKDLRTTAGLGLRVLLDRARNINLRIDYGFSKETQGFYLTIGESF